MLCDLINLALTAMLPAVLILVLMEYALRCRRNQQRRVYDRVLILVLMEYALRY